jgi:hypothetical protein
MAKDMMEGLIKMSEPKSGLEIVADVYADLVKSTIAIPIDGCKSMAIGCPTVAGIYGALLAFIIFGSQHQAVSASQRILIAVPFCFFLLAGLAFSTAVLPNKRLYTLLPDDLTLLNLSRQKSELIARESHIHKWRWRGTIIFWLGIAIGLGIVMFDRVKTV